MTATTNALTLSDVWDNMTPVEDAPCACVEWGDGRDLRPAVVWEEDLSFHVARGDVPASTEDAEECPAWRDRLTQRLRELIPAGFAAYVDWGAFGLPDDARAVTFTVELDKMLPGDMREEDAWQVMWPAIATLHNITDPGTFGSEYLFSGMGE